MRSKVLLSAGIVAVFLPVFLRIYLTDNVSDHARHLDFIREGKIPVYPLFHWSVWLASGFDMRYAATVILTLATVATALLSLAYLRRSPLRSFALAEAAAIPTALVPNTQALSNPLHIGLVKPNVVYNPTTIFAMPFAVATFWLATRSLRSLTLPVAVGLMTLLSLSELAKPNFAMALIPPLAVALWSRPMAFSGKIIRLSIVFLLPLFVLYAQSTISPTGHVGIEPFLSGASTAEASGNPLWRARCSPWQCCSVTGDGFMTSWI
jgi:hypothetical protein